MKHYDLKFSKGDDKNAFNKIGEALDNGTDVTLTKEELAGFTHTVAKDQFNKGCDYGYIGMGIAGLTVGGFHLIKRWIKNRRDEKKS